MAPKRKRADDDKNPFDDPPPRGQGILKLTANEFAVARGPCSEEESAHLPRTSLPKSSDMATPKRRALRRGSFSSSRKKPKQCAAKATAKVKAKCKNRSSPKASAKAKTRPAKKAKAKAKSTPKQRAKAKSTPKQRAKSTPKQRAKSRAAKASEAKTQDSNSESSSNSSDSSDSSSNNKSSNLADKPPAAPEPVGVEVFSPVSCLVYDSDSQDECMPKSKLPESALGKANQAVSLRDMFSHHFRSVQRIQEHWGNEAVIRLRDNLDYMRVTSLYSGLGGAELSASLAHVATADHCRRHGLVVPAAPIPTMACEVDASCQKVLEQHTVSRLPCEHVA